MNAEQLAVIEEAKPIVASLNAILAKVCSVGLHARISDSYTLNGSGPTTIEVNISCRLT